MVVGDSTSVVALQLVRGAEGSNASGKSADPTQTTPEEERIVRELQQRDREVRQHEQAHSRVGGAYTGVPSYQYTRGPDGRLYALSGEVSIDVSPGSSPEATIAKMDVVIRAALAPAEPSTQDRAVANAARQIKLQAQAELQAEKAAEEQQAAERRRQRESGAPPAAVAAAQAYNQAASVLSQIAGATVGDVA